jgi:hypothetical protein
MMLKRILAFSFSLLFCLICFSSSALAVASNVTGKYPVQQASIDDSTGEYTLMLLNTPPGTSPIFRTTNLQMARLTEAEINNGETNYAEIKGNGDEVVMHLTEDFRIEYIHNETEVVQNPQTGKQETVIVRRESNFWTPFAGALAGQALGSLLFTPQYYMPPVYVSGRGLTGVGGYGSTYNQAVSSFRQNHNTTPTIEKNRQAFRKTGSLKTNTAKGFRKSNGKNLKSTGSGFGSSNLRTSGKSNRFEQPSKKSFGTKRPRSFSRSRPMRRSFGRRR